MYFEVSKTVLGRFGKEIGGEVMKNDMWVWAGFLAIVLIVTWAFGCNFDEPFDSSNMLLFEFIYPSK
tara:strand:- start:4269 stop:4469 length:201 start_codon:yes stop_codon:yes gene_type:complete